MDGRVRERKHSVSRVSRWPLRSYFSTTVGIVIGTDGTNVYTVEGNSGNACKIKSYPLNSGVIRGYGFSLCPPRQYCPASSR